MQAAETEEIGSLLFSTRQHDVKRLKKTIQDRTNETYNFEPELCLRWRKMTDPTKSFRGKRGDKQKASQDNEKVTQTLYIEVVKGSAAPIIRSLSRMYSKTLNKYPDNEKMRFIVSPTYIQNS